ncbi:ABC transporter substrate-binding protein [Bradyrhizobium sp.]|uniref:ABC transporter substrate-binding protein n=1 Tax=Bradyrhizobium sp. TaxID=376 RepID=UPI0026248B89|nr:ABC transporter substrate-binding protein [Bradyrhizobium sp.]
MAIGELPVVTVNVFPGGFNWAVYVGEDKGFFEDAGIAVEVQDTPNSVTQMTDFSLGKFDIAMTAVDNIVAYVEGQGEAPIGAQSDFMAIMGSDSSFLSLVASPSIARIEDLKGKTVSVDAATTGYAFVLYEILRRHGLNKDGLNKNGLNKDGLDKDKGDYEIARAGGMVQRWNALREGKHAATLLSAPYNIVAQNAGFTELVKAIDVIGPYQGNVAAVRRPWAQQNHSKVEAYIRAYRRSIAWLYEPGNRGEAMAILRRHLPQMTPEMADASYRELLDPAHGFFRSCEIDRAGFDCVLELRSRYGLPHKQLDDPAKYCDLSFG